MFTAPVAPDSGIPALLGFESMQEKPTIIDTQESEFKMYLGPDCRIFPGPNTTFLQLHRATSRRLMLPVTGYQTQSTAGPNSLASSSFTGVQIPFRAETANPSARSAAAPSPAMGAAERQQGAALPRASSLIRFGFSKDITSQPPTRHTTKQTFASPAPPADYPISCSATTIEHTHTHRPKLCV